MKFSNIIKNNAKMYIIMLIIIILGTMGITFAISMAKFNDIDINSTALNVEANINYNNNGDGTEIVGTNNLLPISDELVTGPDITDTRVLKTTFSVTGNTNNPDNTIYDIALHDINIDCIFRTNDLKWRLYKENSLLSEGTLSPEFDTMSGDRLVLTNTQEDLTENTDNYTFLLWISESCPGDVKECASSLDQSKYLGKTLTASIKAEVSTGSKKDVSRITGSEGSCSYTEVEVPYCNNLTYNGQEQTIINTGSNYTLINDKGVNAGVYTVTARLNKGCKWSNGSIDNKVLTCNITKKDVTITTLNQGLVYGSGISSLSSNVSVSGLLNSDRIASVNLEATSLEVGVGSIITNGVKIEDGSGNDVTSNYNIIKQNNGVLTLSCSNIAVEPTITSYQYTGSELTGVTGGAYVTINGIKSATEAGVYKVEVTPNKNYCWSDNTTITKEYSWSITSNYIINLNVEGVDEVGTSKLYVKINDGLYLDSEYNNKMTTSENPIDLPEKTGYIFDGYYVKVGETEVQVINSNGYITEDSLSVIEENVNVYAKWTRNKYQVTVDYLYYEDGIATDPVRFDRKNLTVEEGTIFKPSEHLIAKEHAYADYFRYYYSYDDGSWELVEQKNIDETFIVTQKMIVNIYYFPEKYTITYNANGGSGAPEQQEKLYQNDLTLSSDKPTRSGYTFLGWSTSSDATSATYAAGATFTIDENTTLYAVWKGNTYTVNFYDNLNYIYDKDSVIVTLDGRTYYKATDGPALVGYDYGTSTSTTGPILVSTDSNSVAYYYSDDTTVRTSTSSISKNGFTFYYSAISGWKSGNLTDTSGLERTKYSGARVNVAALLVDDMSSTVSQTLTYGTSASLTANAYTKTGFTFAGWSTSPTGEVEYTDTESVKNLTSVDGGIINLYAIWEATPYHMTIHHYLSEESSSTRFDSTPTDFKYGLEIHPSNYVVNKEGYIANKVNYYYSYDDGSYKYVAQKDISGSFLITQKMILNIYYKLEEYTVTYNANGGSGAPDSQTKKYGVDLTLSSDKPTRDGYTFLGWSTNKSATSATYSAGGTYNTNEATTLYAVWKSNYANTWVKGNSGTLTFNSNSASSTSCASNIQINWSETYNAYKNTSIVSIDSMYFKVASSNCGSSFYFGGAQGVTNMGVFVNGEQVQYMNRYNGTHSCWSGGSYALVNPNSGTAYPWKTGEITHNSDGTLKIYVTLYLRASASAGEWYSDYNISKSIVLTDTR